MSDDTSVLVQYYPMELFTKLRYEIREKTLGRIQKNIFSERKDEIPFADVDPNYSKGRSAFDNWGNPIPYLFGILFGLYIFHASSLMVMFNIRLGNIILSAILLLFFLRFIKYDFATFYDNNGKFVCSVRYSKSSEREKKFVEKIVQEIRKTKGDTSLAISSG